MIELTVLSDDFILRNQKQSITVPHSNPYIAAATSENTRRAYQADIRHFEKWSGELPASRSSVTESATSRHACSLSDQ